MKIVLQKLKIPMILLLMGTFLLNSTPSFAQSLEGKWNIAKMNTQNSTVIQFTKDSLIFYEFDKRRSATSYHIKDNRLAVGAGSIPIGGEFEFMNPQRLRLKPEQAKSPIDFVRLKPTTTTLTRAEIAQLNFEMTYQNRTLPLNFDGEEDESGQTIQLEIIDSTYFISFYRKDRRMGAMPIEQVTTKKIMVYGFPEKPFVVSGERVISNGNTIKTNKATSANADVAIAEIIIGKWFYNHIEGWPSLSDCTKKTFFKFKEDFSLQTKPYAENPSNGNCIAGSSINGTYELLGTDQIKVTQNDKTETWKIQSLTKTKLVVERDGSALTLTKK